MSATKRISHFFLSLFAFIFFITSASLAQNTGGASSQIQPAQASQIVGQADSHSSKAREFAGRIPLSFEPNQGQAAHDVQYLAHPSGNTLLLSSTGASFLLAAGEEEQPNLANRRRSRKLHTEVVDMRFVQANPQPEISATDPQPHTSSYFTGRDPKGWQVGVPHYARLRYQAVYPGIDLVFHGDQREFEYDFVISPGADPNRIALAFEGGQVSLEPQGDLVISAQGGAELRHRRPVAYQWNAGKRTEVPAAFAMRADGSVGFTVGAYDRSRELLIDPVLVYSTYFGGTGNVIQVPSVAVDQLGNAYLYATTPSATQFFADSCPTCTTGAGMNVFIAKFDPTGLFLWATYLGGSGSQYSQPTDAGGITANAGGVYVAGATTSTDFPVTPGAYQQTCNVCAVGGTAGFVSKLAPDGQSLVYSTYLSAQGNGMCTTQSSAIAVDSSGSAYTAGLTCDRVSTDITESFPVSSSTVFQPTSQAVNNSYSGLTAFVTKLDPTGSTILYSSYLGGSVVDMATSVSVDAAGDFYVSGITDSPDFPTSPARKPGTGGLFAQGWSKLSLGEQDIIAVGSSATGVIYAATATDGIFKSPDGGATWSFAVELGPVNFIKVDPQNPNNIYLGMMMAGLILKSTDGLETVNPLTASCDGRLMAIDPQTPTTIYCSSGGAILKSTEGGEDPPPDWTPGQGLPGAQINSIAIDPNNHNVLYVALNGKQGIYQSQDYGATWSKVYPGPTDIPTSTFALAITQGQPAGQLSDVYASNGIGGVLKSTNGGATWSWMNPSAPRLSGTFFCALRAFYDPVNKTDALWGATTQYGMLHSPDGGVTWDTNQTGLGSVDTTLIPSLSPYAGTYNCEPEFSTNALGWGPILMATSLEAGFFAKFNPSGALGYSVLIDGSGSDYTEFSAIDAQSNAYVTGFTSSTDLPTTPGAQSAPPGGGAYTYVAKLDPSGNIDYLTYLGGTIGQGPNGIAVDSVGQAYVAGWTESSDFPGLNTNPVQGLPAATFPNCDSNGGPFVPCPRVFLTQLNATGTAFLSSAVWGGSNNDQGSGLALDKDVNALVSGYSYSPDFPVSGSAFQTQLVGTEDAVLTKIAFSNTQAGAASVAQPTDPTTNTVPVVLTFQNVLSTGDTTVTTSPTGPAPPSGFSLGNPVTYYNVETNASYSGPIQICINYSGVSFTGLGQPTIWHYTGGGWTQLATTVNAATTTACATTPSLSPFAIMQSAQMAQSITFAPPVSPVTYGVSPITLSATATSGLGVTLSVLSGPGTISGNTLTVTGVGVIVIAANQAGNSDYLAATQVTQSITVNEAPTTTLSVTASPNPATFGNPVTLTATVSSISAPGGTIQFAENTSTGQLLLTPQPIVLQPVNSTTSSASFQIITLSNGTHNIVAIYSGSQDLSGATASTSLTVNPPSSPPFSQILTIPAGAAIATPQVRNNDPSGSQSWFVQADASGLLTVSVIAIAVNSMGPETVQAKIINLATNTQVGSNIVASYPAGTPPVTEVSASGTISTTPGAIYRIGVSTPNTPQPQAFYRLVFQGASEAGMPSPSINDLSSEANDSEGSAWNQTAIWLLNVDAGEQLAVNVFQPSLVQSGPSPATNAIVQVYDTTDITTPVLLIDPNDPTGQSTTTTATLNNPNGINAVIKIADAPTTPRIYAFAINNLSGDYRLSKQSGTDTGIYASWYTAHIGSLNVNVAAGNLPITSVQATILSGPPGNDNTGNVVPISVGSNVIDNVVVGPWQVQLTAPSGYVVTPSELNFNVTYDTTTTINVQVTAPAPVVTTSGNVTTQATSSNGAVATFTATATDAVDGTDPVICTPPSGSLFPIGATTVTCTAKDSVGNTSSATLMVTVTQAAQSISFSAPPPSVNYGTAPITLSATATSGLTVTFSVVSGPGTISGSTLTITGVGTIVIAANQPGNGAYVAATQVTQSITVNSAPQTITFTAPPSPVTYGVSPITLSATGGASGNAVVFNVLSGPGKISGHTLTITGAGTVVIAANQAGNSVYLAATQVTQSIIVNRATLTATANSVSVPYGTPPVLSASITGFVNGDTLSVVSGTPALSTTATSASLPGAYPISIGQGTLSAANYSFALIGGTFTVTFTASAPAKGTLCNGAYDGTFNGNLTVSAGQTCIFVGGGVTGNIQQSGGNLEVIQSTVDGNLQITGGGMYTVTSGSVIKGNLTIQTIPAGTVTNQVCGSTIDGNLAFQSNGTAVLIGAAAPASCSGDTIDGNLTIQSNTASVSVVGNTVKGNVTVQSNSGATIVNSNKVTGNLQDQSNTAPTQVFDDTVGGNLQCQSNTSITGGGDKAALKQQQCSAF